MKGSLLSTALLCSLSASLNAGVMGPAVTPHQMHSFISAEGGYSWHQIDSLNIAVIDIVNVRANETTHGGSGRVAAGLLNPISDSLITSGEIGYGYYGHRTSFLSATGPLTTIPDAPNFGGITTKFTQDGFDALAGIIYYQPNFDLFLKAGALIENTHSQLNVNLPTLVGVNGNVLIKVNHTEVLPEIKLGGSYHIFENLSLIASWSHAFGSNPRINATIDPVNPLGNINVNLQAPTIDIALLGLQYQFS